MATADQIYSLAASALSFDRGRAESIIRQIHAAESRKGNALGNRLDRLLNSRGGALIDQEHPVLQRLKAERLDQMAFIESPAHSLDDLLLPESVRVAVDDLLAGYRHRERLAEFNLPVPHRLLLSGPPGNGKTSLAGAIAHALGLVFITLDPGRVINSHLGETGANLSKLLTALNGMDCVLFIDEMEALLSSKQKAATGEGGDREMARTLAALQMQIDRLSDQTLLIGATNYPELLDHGVPRRFDQQLELPMPDLVVREQMLKRLALRYPGIPLSALGITPKNTEGLCVDEIEKRYIRSARNWVIRNASAQ